MKSAGIARLGSRLATVLLFLAPTAAWAGPPYLTDDPEPTEPGHWEVYGLVAVEGAGGNTEGEAAVEANYGAAPNLQLTVAVPLGFSRGDRRATGLGDIEIAAKYRFFQNETAGFSLATFPVLSLPTGNNGFGGGKVTAFLPLWAQQDAAPWSLFGGGGYSINPGAGNRDFWSGGIAVTRDFSERLQLGAEVARQGAEEVGGAPRTSLGVGVIYKLKAPFSLVASGGPTFADDGGPAQYHGFMALRLDY